MERTERCGQRTKNTGRRKDAGSRSPLTTPPRHAPHNTQTPADNCPRSVSTDHLQHILTTKSAAGTPQQPAQTSAVNCAEQGTPAASLPKPRTTTDPQQPSSGTTHGTRAWNTPHRPSSLSLVPVQLPQIFTTTAYPRQSDPHGKAGLPGNKPHSPLPPSPRTPTPRATQWLDTPWPPKRCLPSPQAHPLPSQQ